MFFQFALFSLIYWAVFFAAAAVVAVAAIPHASYIKSALIGAIVGIAWGFAKFYLVSIISLVYPVPIVGILLTAAVAAATGVAVARFATGSWEMGRWSAVVGVGYTLLNPHPPRGNVLGRPLCLHGGGGNVCGCVGRDQFIY